MTGRAASAVCIQTIGPNTDHWSQLFPSDTHPESRHSLRPQYPNTLPDKDTLKRGRLHFGGTLIAGKSSGVTMPQFALGANTELGELFCLKLKCAVSPAETGWKLKCKMSCVCQVWCFVLDKPLEVNRYGHCQGPSCRGRGEIQELKRYSKYRRWEAEFIIHWSTLVPPVRNSGIIVNITTILFYEIGPIFRSRHECQLWDRMEDYQGQLLLPSQEEGWVASRWF